MEENLQRLAERLAIRLSSEGDIGPCKFSRDKIAAFLAPDLDLNSSEAGELLTHLAATGLLSVSDDGDAYVTVTRPLDVGSARLIRKFCAKHYGEVSPLVDKKM